MRKRWIYALIAACLLALTALKRGEPIECAQGDDIPRICVD